MNITALGIFLLPEILWRQIQNHLNANLPEEACGLVAGTYIPHRQMWRASHIFTIENILHSPVSYLMDGRAQLAAFDRIDQDGLELIAIFHSHPRGPATPSETDRKQCYYRNTIQLICYEQKSTWNCRAYRLDDNEFNEIRLVME